MASHTDADDGPTRRYADVTLANGRVVIYDTTNEDAWIESAVALDAEDLRG